jgi:hypothetical protein
MSVSWRPAAPRPVGGRGTATLCLVDVCEQRVHRNPLRVPVRGYVAGPSGMPQNGLSGFKLDSDRHSRADHPNRRGRVPRTASHPATVAAALRRHPSAVWRDRMPEACAGARRHRASLLRMPGPPNGPPGGRGEPGVGSEAAVRHFRTPGRTQGDGDGPCAKAGSHAHRRLASPGMGRHRGTCG